MTACEATPATHDGERLSESTKQRIAAGIKKYLVGSTHVLVRHDAATAKVTRDRLERILRAAPHMPHFVMGQVERCPYGPGMAVNMAIVHTVILMLGDGWVMAYADPAGEHIPVRKRERWEGYDAEVAERLCGAMLRALPAQAAIVQQMLTAAANAARQRAYEARVVREAPAVLFDVAVVLRQELPARWEDQVNDTPTQREIRALLARVEALLP